MKKLPTSTLSLSLLVSMNAFGAATASSSSPSPSTSSQLKIPGIGSGMLSNDNIVAAYHTTVAKSIVQNSSTAFDDSPRIMVALSPDGDYLAYIALGGDKIHLCSAMETKHITELKEKPVKDIVFTSDGKFLHTTSKNGHKFWNIDTKQPIAIAKELEEKYKNQKHRRLFIGTIFPTLGVRINPEKDTIDMESSESFESLTSRYETATQEDIARTALLFDDMRIERMEADIRGLFCSDGSTIATWNKPTNFNKPEVHLWNARTQKCIATWKAPWDPSLKDGPWNDAPTDSPRYLILWAAFSKNNQKFAVMLGEVKDDSDDLKAHFFVWKIPNPKETLQDKCARIIRMNNLDVFVLPQIIVDLKIYPDREHKQKVQMPIKNNLIASKTEKIDT